MRQRPLWFDNRAAALAAAVGVMALMTAPARAGDGFSFIPYLLGAGSTAGGWETRVSSEPAVADPGWTAIVYARRTSDRDLAATTAVSAGPRPQLNGAVHALNGLASYYWQGQLTASGEVFDKRAMTAAHKTLPIGTRVKVTNLANGRSTVVRINDRGPFVAGRVIDVSEGAADVLGMRQSGLAPVRVDLVQK
jgi:rare lipoprotein A